MLIISLDERIYEDDGHVIELVVPLLTDTDGKVGSMFVKVVWRAGGGRSKFGSDLIELWCRTRQAPPHHMQELLAPTDPEVCSSSAAAPGKVVAQTWTGAYLEDGFVRRLHSKASFPREGTSHCGTSTCKCDNLSPSFAHLPCSRRCAHCLQRHIEEIVHPHHH